MKACEFLYKHLSTDYIEEDVGMPLPWMQCFKKEHRKAITDLLCYEADLCCNPLNLMILCALVKDKGLKEHYDRTELYEDLHCFLKEKARNRLEEDEDLETTVMIPLYKLAYEAYADNRRCYLTEKDYPAKKLDKMCISGFIYKKLRPSRRREVLFHFSHLTIVEYLSAQHLKHLNVDGRKNIIEALEVIPDRSLLKFIVGVLEENALLEVAPFLMDRARHDSNFYLWLLSDMKVTNESELGNILHRFHPESFCNNGILVDGPDGFQLNPYIMSESSPFLPESCYLLSDALMNLTV
jgi:hypothetical protein